MWIFSKRQTHIDKIKDNDCSVDDVNHKNIENNDTVKNNDSITTNNSRC